MWCSYVLHLYINGEPIYKVLCLTIQYIVQFSADRLCSFSKGPNGDTVDCCHFDHTNTYMYLRSFCTFDEKIFGLGYKIIIDPKNNKLGNLEMRIAEAL